MYTKKNNGTDYALVMTRVKKMVNTMTSGADYADDVTQEVLIAVWRSKKEVAEIGSGWLYAVSRNKLYEFYRLRMKPLCPIELDVVAGCVRESGAGESLYELAAKDVDLDSQLDGFSRGLDKALARLTPVQKEVLMLVADGYTYEEIAAVAQVGIGTVRSRLYYARKRMIASLKRVA